MTALTDVRLGRIERRLRGLLGDGPADQFLDAVKIFRGEVVVRSEAMLAWHAAREIESALLAGLAPIAPRPSDTDTDEGRKAAIDAIISVLGLSADDERIVKWRARSLHGRAHRSGSAAQPALDHDDYEAWIAAMDLVTEAFEAKYILLLDRLRTVAAQRPGEDAGKIQTLLRLLPTSGPMAGLHAFFDSADPKWIAQIPDELLDNPPPRIVENNTVRYPGWPVSAYIARAADERPTWAARHSIRIAAAAPDNLQIHRDLAAAALAFSPEDRSKWARAEAAWLDRSTTILHFLPDYGPVIEALCSDGSIEVADALVAAATSLQEGPGHEDGLGLRMRADDYATLVADALTPLAKVDPLRAVEVVIVRFGLLARREHHIDDPARDGSAIWLPAIEDHPQNSLVSETGQILFAGRDAIVAGLIERPSAIRDVVTRLLGAAALTSALPRLGIHLARRFADVDPGLAVEVASDGSIYSINAYHELFELLRAIQPSLTGDSSATIVGAIEGSALDGRLRTALVALVAGPGTQPPLELEDLEPGFLSAMREIEPEPGPVAVSELNAMNVQDVVTWAASFRSQPTPLRRGTESIGYTITQAVEADPARYVAEAEALVGLPAASAQWAMLGLYNADKKTPIGDFEPLIRLFVTTLVEEPRPWSGPDYRETRKHIAWLLRHWLARSTTTLPPGLAEMTWSVLEVLGHDLDYPNSDDDLRVMGDWSAIASMALNSTRPQAIDAVIFYAGRLGGKAGIPEQVKVLLDERADPKLEPSESVPYAVGSMLWAVFRLDRAWATGFIERLFAVEDERLREASWRGYLWYPTIYAELAAELFPQYRRSIEEAGTGNAPQSETEQIGTHLMLLAEIGALRLEGEDGLLAMFIDTGPLELVAKAIEHLGWREWTRREEELPDEAIQAELRSIWRRWSDRLDREGATTGRSFGTWLAARRLGDEWALAELDRLADGERPIAELRWTFEALAELAPLYAVQAGSLTQRLVATTTGDFDLSGNDDVLTEVVASLREVASSIPECGEIADAIVSIVQARGLTRFMTVTAAPSARVQRLRTLRHRRGIPATT